MNNVIEYKGYRGIVEFSAEDQVFFGKIFGINDTVTFEADTVKKLHTAFKEAVHDYLATCESMGKAPEREYKGSFNIRIDPKIHQLAAFKAETLHISLNQFVERAIEKQVSDLTGNTQEKNTPAKAK